jgi:hypothetical protein
MTTLTMQDSIYPQNLTPGADAYLAYVNGKWPTYKAVVARFPGKHVLGMAVTAGVDAEGCDCEQWDLTAGQVPPFVKAQMARGVYRPVVYASASNIPAVLADLTAAGIPRSDIRLLSAHYGAGEHICGPAGCKYPGVPPCDGTQWTDAAPGAGGSKIDQSWLLANFFDPAPKLPVPVQGPVTVTADGKKSLAQIAAAAGTQPSTILRVTAIHDGAFAPLLAGFLNGIFHGSVIPGTAVPAGIVLHLPAS